MRRSTSWMAAGLGLVGLLPAAAGASTMHYEVYWGGFHTAEAALVDDGGPDGYHARLGIATIGLAEDLSGLTVQAEAWGRAPSPGTLAPSRFSADTHAKDSQTRLAVAFDPESPARVVLDVTKRLAAADDGDKPPRPPVPPALRVGTLDPLSALVELGRRAAAAKPGDTFTLPVYDGLRRYDARVTVRGPDTTTVHGHTLSGIEVAVRFKPLAGFRDAGRKLWTDASFRALVDPATGLPLHVVSDDFTVATVINAE